MSKIRPQGYGIRLAIEAGDPLEKDMGNTGLPVAASAGLKTRRRSLRRKGSALLEAAFVFLPMIAITFAIMDYSIGIFVQNALYHAVREGVRFAITQQTGASGQDAAIKQIVLDNSIGFLSGSSGLAAISITYYSPSTLTAVTGVGSNAQGNICLIKVNNFSWSWFAPVLRSSTALQFTAASSDVMEAPPGGVLPTR